MCVKFDVAMLWRGVKLCAPVCVLGETASFSSWSPVQRHGDDSRRLPVYSGFTVALDRQISHS